MVENTSDDRFRQSLDSSSDSMEIQKSPIPIPTKK